MDKENFPSEGTTVATSCALIFMMLWGVLCSYNIEKDKHHSLSTADFPQSAGLVGLTCQVLTPPSNYGGSFCPA